MTGPDDRGVILLNVLLVVAVASAVVVMMTSSQDISLQRTQRLRDAAQALAIAHAGELSAAVALRRDKLESPAVDHLREAWAAVAQTETAIAGGRFSLAISDGEAKFNVNNLASGGAAARDVLGRLLVLAGAPADAVDGVAAYLEAAGPVSDLGALSRAGLSGEVLQRLGENGTALPTPTAVNVNTASESLLSVMLLNPVAARILAAQRSRTGFLNPQDLTAARVILPRGADFTSDNYWVRTKATAGGTGLVLTSLLNRRATGAKSEVVVVLRRRGAAAPS